MQPHRLLFITSLFIVHMQKKLFTLLIQRQKENEFNGKYVITINLLPKFLSNNKLEINFRKTTIDLSLQYNRNNRNMYYKLKSIVVFLKFISNKFIVITMNNLISSGNRPGSISPPP